MAIVLGPGKYHSDVECIQQQVAQQLKLPLHQIQVVPNPGYDPHPNAVNIPKREEEAAFAEVQTNENDVVFMGEEQT